MYGVPGRKGGLKQEKCPVIYHLNFTSNTRDIEMLKTIINSHKIFINVLKNYLVLVVLSFFYFSRAISPFFF